MRTSSDERCVVTQQKDHYLGNFLSLAHTSHQGSGRHDTGVEETFGFTFAKDLRVNWPTVFV